MTRRIVTLLIIAPYKYSFTYLLTLVGRVYMVPVFHRNYVCRLYLVPFLILSVKEWRDLEIWVRSHSRSFKMVPFESLGAVSYSPSTNYGSILHQFRDKPDIGRKS